MRRDRVASNSKVTNFLHNIYTDSLLLDDSIVKKHTFDFIMDICEERGFCKTCWSEKVESIEFGENVIESCNCKERKVSEW